MWLQDAPKNDSKQSSCWKGKGGLHPQDLKRSARPGWVAFLRKSQSLSGQRERFSGRVVCCALHRLGQPQGGLTAAELCAPRAKLEAPSLSLRPGHNQIQTLQVLIGYSLQPASAPENPRDKVSLASIHPARLPPAAHTDLHSKQWKS